MGLPALEAKVLALRFAEEFRDAQAPYYGINIVEVNEDNWEAFIEVTKAAHDGVRTFLGGHSHLWTVRDYGHRKRVLWVNYYPENVGHLQTKEVFDHPNMIEYWQKHTSLVEKWDWYISSVEPSEPPEPSGSPM